MPDNIKPNLRFATSFLHKRFQQYAVPGEVLQDEMTGEIFVKRVPDNRIVSYTQQNKYLHDIMVELRMYMKGNTDYKIPTDPKSVFYINDYDIQLMNGSRFNVLEDDVYNTNIRIQSSKNTNGFFIKPMTRVTDKSYVESLTSMYNRYFDDTDIDMDPNTLSSVLKTREINDEKVKSQNKEYVLSNLQVSLNVTVTGVDGTNQNRTVSYDIVKDIRFNMLNFIPFSHVSTSVIKTIKRVDVVINSFSFNKLNNCGRIVKSGTYPHSSFRLISTPDLLVVFDRLQISGFSDNVSEVPVGDQQNYSSILILENRYMLDYLYKIDNLGRTNSFILSRKKPMDSEWFTNNAWVEVTAIIRNAIDIVNTDHATDVKDLEKFIYYNSGTTTKFTLDRTEAAHILIAPVTTP